jgi:hypothetical protein
MGSVRVWVSPSGFVLCSDQQFTGLVGLPGKPGTLNSTLAKYYYLVASL